MLNEVLENGVKEAFMARMPGGLAEYGHVLRVAGETAPVPQGDEHAPMVVIRIFDGSKKGTRLWRYPYEVTVTWNVDATASAAADAMVRGIVERFHELPGDDGAAELGWIAELNGELDSAFVVRWWVADVKHSDPEDREKQRVISGHVWAAEK